VHNMVFFPFLSLAILGDPFSRPPSSQEKRPERGRHGSLPFRHRRNRGLPEKSLPESLSSLPEESGSRGGWLVSSGASSGGAAERKHTVFVKIVKWQRSWMPFGRVRRSNGWRWRRVRFPGKGALLHRPAMESEIKRPFLRTGAFTMASVWILPIPANGWFFLRRAYFFSPGLRIRSFRW
jgi:hypothetical protein